MIQDIEPYRFVNHFFPHTAAKEDILLCFDQDMALLRETEAGIVFPCVGELALPATELIYLFTLDGECYFLAEPQLKVEAGNGLVWHAVNLFRNDTPQHMAFAGITGWQLYRWYRDHRFCGACAAPLMRGEQERSLICPACGRVQYPPLAPAVIIGVVDGDRLLLTRYANRPNRRWALVAGYVEIGETVEDCIRREVLEEVGLSVRNLRYYKSQPWSFSDSLLLGYFCDAEPDEIVLDHDELAEAVWFASADLPHIDSSASLTSEMIEVFRSGEYPR